MRWRCRLQDVFLAVLTPAAASGAPETNFSQHPGFAPYFADNPPKKTAATLEQRQRLERYRPLILIPENHPGLIDFYRGYVAHGNLFDGRGRLVSDAVEQKLLNQLKADPRAEFRHLSSGTDSPDPVIYGRIGHARITDPSGQEGAEERFLSLTYHAVFRHSGLPKALNGWKAALPGLL